MAGRVIETKMLEEDIKLEGSLRPQTLQDYIGQQKAKEILSIYIEAARQRNGALHHVLFYGPPGLGGATTRAGLLTAPLRDRFGVIQHLEFYSIEELVLIIQHSARILNVEIDEKGAVELARRSRGTPRLANRILRRVRDFAQVRYDGRITEEVANTALDLLDVDKLGLDQTDRHILTTMIDKFHGGPVGLDTLAAAIGEDNGTIEEVYEPYLIKNGLIMRTPRGRVVTELCYHHLGLEFPP